MSAVTVDDDPDVGIPLRPTLRLTFPDRTYLATDLADLWTGLDDLWRGSCRLAYWELLLRAASLPEPAAPVELAAWRPGVPVAATVSDAASRLGEVIRRGRAFVPPPFAVPSLSLASPLQVDIAWVPELVRSVTPYLLAGGTGALFRRVLTDPRPLGRWLPGLVEGWTDGLVDLRVARRRLQLLKEATAEEIGALYQARRYLDGRGLVPESVTETGRSPGPVPGRAVRGVPAPAPASSPTAAPTAVPTPDPAGTGGTVDLTAVEQDAAGAAGEA